MSAAAEKSLDESARTSGEFGRVSFCVCSREGLVDEAFRSRYDKTESSF